MKTKFTCMLLCVLMLVTAMFTGCSNSNNLLNDIAEEAEEARNAMTLVVYLMSEKEVPDATVKSIEESINKLTKSKYKTQLELHYFTPDEYYPALEAKLKAKEVEIRKAQKEVNDKRKWEKYIRDSLKEAGITTVAVTTKAQTTEETEEETLVNEEYGIIEYKYPDAEPNQLDIFYLGGYANYVNYRDNGWLADLKEEVNNASKKLKEHLLAIYMDNVTKGGMYGIPTNSPVGEYTWMLLDKELMTKYFWEESSISSISDENLYNFLNDIYTYERDEDGNLNVLPVKGELSPVNVYYWTINDIDAEEIRFTNQPSVIGGSYTNASAIGNQIPAKCVYNDNLFIEQTKMIKRFTFDGFFGSEEEKNLDRYAMTVVKGSYDVYLDNCENYYVKMLSRPRILEDELYSNMLCVNELEDNVKRTMEIVTYINTNYEARNILQYGIENENYYIDDNDVLHRYNDSYMMDVKKTGNIFMAHPEEGLPSGFWQSNIRQNEDARMYPVYGFTIEEPESVDLEAVVECQKLAPEWQAKLDACTTIEEVDAFFNEAKTVLAKLEIVDRVARESDPKEEEDPSAPKKLPTLQNVYHQWLVDNGYIKVD